MMTQEELETSLPDGWEVTGWTTHAAKGADIPSVTVALRNTADERHHCSWTCPLTDKPMEMQFQQFLLDFGLKERAVA